MKMKSKYIITSGFRRLVLYILGAVCFLLQPCQSALKVYLNLSSINLSTSTKIDGFSFQFQTCAPGVLLKSLDRDFKIEIVPGNRTKHSHIRLSWNDTGTIQTVELAQYYSVDANVVTMLELTLQTDSAVFSITNMDVLPNQKFSITTTKLKGLNLTNSFQIGSSSYTGCLDSGTNINIDGHASTCPLTPLVACSTTICPDGFTDRYCEINIDECAKNECYSFSTCIDLINGFKCVCGKQWTGRLCNKYLGDLCANNPCQNDGLCQLIDGKNNYTCTCRTNYVGDNCETFVDPCSNSPCKNGGTCSPQGNTSVPNKYNCACDKGFKGIHCELKEDVCGSYPCNKGKCTPGVNGTFTCDCSNTGLYGDQCQNNINECLQNPCANNATCNDKWGSYDCQCLAGFSGSQCGVNIDECSPNPCVNGGTCTDGINSYTCKCQPGYNGDTCELNIDECLTHKCNKSSTEKCVDLVNAYECSCKAGYSGQFCETDIDDCNPNPCQNSAQCVDLVANYHCICKPGYNGRNCSNNIDDCVNKCNGHGTCTDGIDQYTCACNAGFTGNDCETNIDNCSPNPCQHFGQCRDGVNDYTCDCIPSYIGKNCTTYRDPCKPTNPCFFNNTCLDDPQKGYTCNCTSAYDGDRCQHKYGPCYPNPCTHGNCSEENNIFKCTCSAGYRGTKCDEDINECEPNPCKNGGTCTDKVNGFTCTCPIDRFVKSNCVDFIYMCPQYKASNGEVKCKNGGTCNELGLLETNCTCKPGFVGERCETDIDECSFNYCQNHLSCKDLVNDYTCECIAGYTNKNCTENIDECAGKPCSHGGVCTDKINDFSCKCKTGYEGKKCEVDIDWCTRLNPCKNGAQCKDGVETYTCTCLPGFQGLNCSTDINECLANPCVYGTTSGVKHESTCVEKSKLHAMKSYNFTVDETSFANRDGYVCVCKPGLSGTNCSTNPNDCTNTTCTNGATCTDLINDFKCNCKPGFSGTRCQVNIDECSPNPCKFGSTCRDGINDYTCDCVNNTLGKDCSTLLSNCSQHNPCKNGATSCLFIGSKYECDCASSFGGELCTEVTNINFGGNGYWQLTQQEMTDAMAGSGIEGYYLIFSWATTLPTVWLVHIEFVSGLSFGAYINQNVLTLSFAGEIHTFVMYSNMGMWHDLMISVNKNGWQTMMRPHAEEINKTSQSGFETIKSVYFGGVPKSTNSTRSDYTGCMRDFKIGAKRMIPKNTYSDASVGKCGRKEVCFKDSCSGHGKCIDEWRSNKCECNRQYYGDKCQSEIQPFSFGFVAEEAKKNTTTKKRRSVDSNYAYSDINGKFDDTSTFSFLVRTRQTNAFIALLTEPPPASLVPHLLVYLKDGKINVRSLISGVEAAAPEAANNGEWHVVAISPKGISNNGKMHAFPVPLTSFNVSRIYIGGADPAVYNNKAYYTDVNFDGCFQAVKLRDHMLTNENLPTQKTAGLSLNGGKTHIGSCPDNKPCKSTPCLYGGNCINKWYDYDCNCTQGFTGKTCSSYGCQNVNPCQVKADCVDLPSQIGKTQCQCKRVMHHMGCPIKLLQTKSRRGE